MEEDVDAPSQPVTVSKIEKRFFKSRNEKQCHFCEFKTETLTDLNDHLLEHHWKAIFRCNLCNMYLPHQQLMPHMTEHAQKSLQVSPTKRKSKLHCESCQKSFKSISGIKYHMSSVHAEFKHFKCSACNYECITKRLLENHERSIHKREIRSYKCKTCGKSFKTDSTLYTHNKLHMDEKPLECDVCGKRFRLKHHLLGHLVQHKDFSKEEQLPHACKYCQKQFAALDNLRKHLKIHDRTLGDFICHICGAKMLQKRYLRQHMKNVHLQGNQHNKI